MEDFDYIDALAQGELSNRTATPSVDGWANVQQKMRRKKRRRFLVFFLLFAVLCSFGIYQGINTNTDFDAEHTSVTNKNLEQLKSGNSKNSETNTVANSESDSTSVSNSTSDSVSNSDSISNSISKNNTSQAGTYSLQTKVTASTTQSGTANTIQGERNNSVRNNSEVNSNSKNKNTNIIYNGVATTKVTSKENQFSLTEKINFEETAENFVLNASGAKLYPWELITPETLKKKREKKKSKVEPKEIYENMDLMVGLNGFFTSNDYKLAQSFVVELSYTEEKKLKNEYYFNYGASLQFRNLRFKNDSLSFNSGELSVNILSNIEKRFGNFGIEAGVYIGYEFSSPNNKIFNNIGINFFEQKINYGLATALRYRKIALVFKYEFSPYIDYLGTKRTGAFTIGVKYDF